MGLEGRKRERGSFPEPGQGAENGDTHRVSRTGLDTADDGCETREIPRGRDLSLAALRSPDRCHPSRAQSEAAEHGAVQGRLRRAGIVLLECQQSCGGAAVPPRHAGGHSPPSEHSPGHSMPGAPSLQKSREAADPLHRLDGAPWREQGR